MRKFFCSELSSPGCEVTLEGREAEHLFRVLRAREGEEVELISGDGRKALAVVRGKGRLEVLSVASLPEEKLRFHLFFAPPRRNRLDLLLTQAVEIGVAELHPVLFARGVAESEPNDRWQLHLREGCKQSGNPRLPVVHPLCSLDRALADFAAVNGTGYYGSVTEAECSAPAGTSGEIGWIVGPEGGFTDEETAAIEKAGWRPLHLGPHILRLETAAVCGIAVLRKMLFWFLPLIFCAVILAGCGGGRDQIEKNPLVLKARQYVKEGDSVLARDFYRRALCKYPSSPLLHLELAQLCDESLGAYAEAIHHYDEYLRLVPEDAPGHKETVLYRRLAVNRFILEQNPELQKTMTSAAEPENPQLREENTLLRRQIEKMKLMIHRQHLRLNELQRAAAAASAAPAGTAAGENVSGSRRYHTIVSGDTPGGIAKRYRVPLRELLRVNGLRENSVLRVGRKLIVPAPAGQ